ncbi:MAG TPA: hypothetical protein VGL51_17470 [Solirubrobacteraceae bacterium]
MVLAVAVGTVVALGQGPGRQLEYGFNDEAGWQSYRLQSELGAPVRRILVGWNQVQPTDGTWRWAQIDVIYAALLKAHLRPLLVALAPPCWSHPVEACGGANLGVTPQDVAYDRAWSEFIRRLTARYPAAVGIEIWNEENLAAGFLPRPDPVRYTQLLEEAYRAVKSVRPTMPVISGGLFVSAVSGPSGIGDAQFLQGMYAAGAKGFMDGIGIHLYPVAGSAEAQAEEVEDALGALRAVRDAAGDESTPIWVTEVGVSTQMTSGRRQAGDLITIVKRLRRDDDIRAVIVHRLVDLPEAAADPPGVSQSGYGVFQADHAPKPAACALSLLWHGTLRC